MVTVASKELKNRLGRYLQLVRKGEAVRITDRGRPIGCILPLEGTAEAAELEALYRLSAAGTLTLGTGRLQPHGHRARLKRGPSTAKIIAEGRR
ncbi:MAG TPA: type II toxin-antitoxin system prevent-host-death family antitoxin [Bryobacteraceae bacterium]|nr:type II toxin-antitoxin system prevent-host-death family antitoxin [Bryobacteraceae bacterium]